MDGREVFVLVLTLHFVGIFEFCLWQLTKGEPCSATVEVVIVPPRPDSPTDSDIWLEWERRLHSGSLEPSSGSSS